MRVESFQYVGQAAPHARPWQRLVFDPEIRPHDVVRPRPRRRPGKDHEHAELHVSLEFMTYGARPAGSRMVTEVVLARIPARTPAVFKVGLAWPGLPIQAPTMRANVTPIAHLLRLCRMASMRRTRCSLRALCPTRYGRGRSVPCRTQSLTGHTDATAAAGLPQDWVVFIDAVNALCKQEGSAALVTQGSKHGLVNLVTVGLAAPVQTYR
jgi:hypothetical protein